VRPIKRVLPVVAVAIAAAAYAAGGGASPAATPTLVGTDGPGFTITLKMNGKKVTKLKAGTYNFVINDKSNIHNFHLKGPHLDAKMTTVAFVGTKKAARVKLGAGKYTYVCDPHVPVMKGSFTVL
jgi:plastocyanin